MSLGLIVAATAFGVLIGLVTEVRKGRKASHDLPGGSIAAGLVVGLIFDVSYGGLVPLLVGGISGLLGWLLYCFFAPIKSKK